MIQFKINKPTFREVQKNMDFVIAQIQRRAMKDSLMKAATPAVKAAKARAPKKKAGTTGLLRRSIKKKGKTYRQRGMAFVVVGPDKGVVGELDGKKVWPVKYAHLVEFGHRKKGGGRVSPRPFMRPAFEANKETMKRIYGESIGPAVERQAANAARRQKKRR